jgi:TetR/AcrR family transcriptional regulator, mexJK operon transcriptional repressor
LSKKFPTVVKKPLPSARLRPRPGRPTREQAEQRHELLLDRALDVFLEYGYELATIDEIIGSIGMHKNTVYSLYADKKALFRAAVERAIRRGKQPVGVLKAAETDDFEVTLVAIARLLLANSVSPVALKLQRIIIAETFRVPEITRMFWEQGPRASAEYLTELFERYAKRGEIQITEPELVAHGFLTLTVGLMSRMILVGTKIDPREMDKRIKLYVKIFLNGIRPQRKA